MANVGKYTSPMDAMGIESGPFTRKNTDAVFGFNKSYGGYGSKKE